MCRKLSSGAINRSSKFVSIYAARCRSKMEGHNLQSRYISTRRLDAEKGGGKREDKEQGSDADAHGRCAESRGGSLRGGRDQEWGIGCDVTAVACVDATRKSSLAWPDHRRCAESRAS